MRKIGKLTYEIGAVFKIEPIWIGFMSRKITPDAKQRFSNRVENYIKYRPGYPTEIIPFLSGAIGLSPDTVIADVGSGTGILSDLFLRNGNTVYGVEPNDGMRQAAERLLGHCSNFHSHNGAAEATTLPPASIDLVTAGQVFHWFELEQTQQEFRRILKPGGQVVLISNTRKAESVPLMQAYEALLHQYGINYAHVAEKNVNAVTLELFFGGQHYSQKLMSNFQYFDFASLQGRLLSSSYAPPEGHPNYAPMMAELHQIFRRFQSEKQVQFEYATKIYYGPLQA